MNRRDKKRLEILKKLKQRLLQQIAGAKKQTDDDNEIPGLEKELAKIDQELEELKAS